MKESTRFTLVAWAVSVLVAVALGLAVAVFMASPAKADANYPPTCVDCDTADTGGVTEFTDTGINPVKAALFLGLIGTAAVVVARRRRA